MGVRTRAASLRPLPDRPHGTGVTGNAPAVRNRRHSANTRLYFGEETDAAGVLPRLALASISVSLSPVVMP
jgi:hypothetical protein